MSTGYKAAYNFHLLLFSLVDFKVLGQNLSYQKSYLENQSTNRAALMKLGHGRGSVAGSGLHCSLSPSNSGGQRTATTVGLRGMEEFVKPVAALENDSPT